MKIKQEKLDEINNWMRKHDLLCDIWWENKKWLCWEEHDDTPRQLTSYKNRWGNSFRNKVGFILKHKGIEEQNE